MVFTLFCFLTLPYRWKVNMKRIKKLQVTWQSLCSNHLMFGFWFWPSERKANLTLIKVTTSETGFLLSTLDTVIKEGFWIGLINPMGVACQDAVCLDQLSWVSYYYLPMILSHLPNMILLLSHNTLPHKNPLWEERLATISLSSYYDVTVVL